MAEFLTLVHIRDVYLHHRRLNASDGILQGDAGMGVGTRIQHHTVVAEPYLVQLVEQITFVVRLEITQFCHIGKALFQLFEVIFKSTCAINAWFAATQQIQVGTIENQYLLHCFNLF